MNLTPINYRYSHPANRRRYRGHTMLSRTAAAALDFIFCESPTARRRQWEQLVVGAVVCYMKFSRPVACRVYWSVLGLRTDSHNSTVMIMGHVAQNNKGTVLPLRIAPTRPQQTFDRSTLTVFPAGLGLWATHVTADRRSNHWFVRCWLHSVNRRRSHTVLREVARI